MIAHKNRAGANLFTGSIVALNADTGRMAWYFQSSPHDTHDWDSTQTAVLFDGVIDGQPRKLIAQAARNGHFFVLDRTNGKAIVSTEYVKTNWSLGYDAKGQPIPNPAKMPQIDGALVSPDQGGATNWQSPTFSPLTGLFYVNASRAFSVYYIYDPSDQPAGWGGTDRGGWSESMLHAIDYQTGKIRWRHPWPAGQAKSGLLSTAGNVLFTAGSGGLAGAQRHDRRCPLARPAAEPRQQRPHHVRARRPAIRRRGRRIATRELRHESLTFQGPDSAFEGMMTTLLSSPSVSPAD